MNDLPKGWVLSKLGDIADTQLGKMLNKSKQTGTHLLPYLRSLNVQWGAINIDDLKHMDIEPDEWGKYTLQKGDLLICEGGESGRSAIWQLEELIGFQNALHRVRTKGKVLNIYLYYYFEWLVKNKQIEHLFNGVTIKHFPQENLRSVEIAYPPIDEQIRIVEIVEEHLSRIDSALEDVKQAREKADQFRRSLLHAAFTGQLTGENEQTDWVESKFGDRFKVKYGKAIDKSLRNDTDQYPVVGSAGIMSHTAIPLVKEPSLIIGRKGNVGSIQYFESGCYPIDTTYYFTCPPDIDMNFLTYQLKSLELQKLDSSTTTPSLRREDLESISLLIPPMEEQKKMVKLLDDYLSKNDNLIEYLKDADKSAAQLRKSLLHAAFTGQLTNEDANV